MANIITAGNSTNGGTSVTTDTSGTLNIVTGSGSGANAITIDASQNVTTLANLTVTGTLSASGGVSGGIRSGTAVASTSGTSIDFTSLPTGIKRITVMFSGVSTNGTSNIIIQLGDSDGIETTGYLSGVGYRTGETTATTGLIVCNNASAALNFSGVIQICLYTTNSWVTSGVLSRSDGFPNSFGGTKATSSTLDRVRITTINGTDTFDAGSINIFYE